MTYYFEKEFNLKQNELDNLKSLIIRHAIDDGALVHINGKEVLRVNMPDGKISSSSLASENIEVDELSENIFLDSSSLIKGQNRISVEVHQSRIGNSDIVFGIELDAEIIESINSTSEKIFINELPSANEEKFWIELINGGTTSANLEGIVISVGADPNREYLLPEQSLNTEEIVVIDEDTLGFRPKNGEKIFLYNKSISSVLDSREQTNRLRGRASEKDGEWLFPQGPTPLSKNQFSFNDRVVISEICYNPPGLAAIKEIPPTFETVNIVPFNSVWRFDRSGNGQPQGWHQLNHSLGNAWEQGIGPIGRETGNLPVPLGTAWSRDEYSSGTTTYYFETNFNCSFIEFFSSSTVFFLKLAPYQPEHKFRLNSFNFGNSSFEVFGNFPPDSIPINPAWFASDKHCSKGVSPPNSGMSSFDHAIGAIPNFTDINIIFVMIY